MEPRQVMKKIEGAEVERRQEINTKLNLINGTLTVKQMNAVGWCSFTKKYSLVGSF